MWRQQHVAGHHVWTNVHGLDPDIRVSEADVRRVTPFQPWHPYQVGWKPSESSSLPVSLLASRPSSRAPLPGGGRTANLLMPRRFSPGAPTWCAGVLLMQTHVGLIAWLCASPAVTWARIGRQCRTVAKPLFCGHATMELPDHCIHTCDAARLRRAGKPAPAPVVGPCCSEHFML